MNEERQKGKSVRDQHGCERERERAALSCRGWAGKWYLSLGFMVSEAQCWVWTCEFNPCNIRSDLLMAATWPWVCEVAQSWQLCLAVWHSPVSDHPIYRAILSGPQRDSSAQCPATVTPHSQKSTCSWLVSVAMDVLEKSWCFLTTRHMCTQSQIWVYFFSIYTCVVLLTLVDLSRCMSGQNQTLCSVSEKGVGSWAGVLNKTHDY